MMRAGGAGAHRLRQNLVPEIAVPFRKCGSREFYLCCRIKLNLKSAPLIRRQQLEIMSGEHSGTKCPA
jgi:hypothetical protein